MVTDMGNLLTGLGAAETAEHAFPDMVQTIK